MMGMFLREQIAARVREHLGFTLGLYDPKALSGDSEGRLVELTKRIASQEPGCVQVHLFNNLKACLEERRDFGMHNLFRLAKHTGLDLHWAITGTTRNPLEIRSLQAEKPSGTVTLHQAVPARIVPEPAPPEGWRPSEINRP